MQKEVVPNIGPNANYPPSRQGVAISRSNSNPSRKSCVPPSFLSVPDLRIPSYKVFSELVTNLGSSGYPYGSMARSGIEIRSVAKISKDGKHYYTLGAFSTCRIPKHSLITFYGGEKKYKSDIIIKSHAMSLPGSIYAEDGKGLSMLFQRHNKAGLISLPIKYPNMYMHGYQSGGIGYMMNHATSRKANCVLKYMNPPRILENMGYDPVPFLASSRDIAPFEELTFNYNNAESKLYD